MYRERELVRVDDSHRRGLVRVGRRTETGYGKNVTRNDPSFTNFEPIIVLTKGYSKWGAALGPYYLKDNEGHIFENIWQFSKVYSEVPKSVQRYSRYDDRIIWDWPAETHVTDGKVNDKYWKWRKAGYECKDAIRYPVGFNHRHKCLYSLTEDGRKLDYIEARKEIYLKLYIEMVKKEPLFKELKRMLENGKNLLIIEVDGPHQESLGYYKDKYDVDDDFIEGNTILVNEKNMDTMLNDPKHPFGHGYCLAIALLDMEL